MVSEGMIQEKRSAYASSLDEALVRILSQLAEISTIEKVILFGSYATGHRDLFTDIDLLVVMNTDLNIVQRTVDLYGKIQTNVDLDLFVFTPAEMKANRWQGLVQRASETGQVVYEKSTN